MQRSSIVSQFYTLKNNFIFLSVIKRSIFITQAHLTTETLPDNYQGNKNVESSLWFTSLPHRRKNALSLMSKKKMKSKWVPSPDAPLLISCKNKELNHYQGQLYGKLDLVPLASKGWHHRMSKGDYFTIQSFSEHPAFILPNTEVPRTFTEIGIDEDIRKVLKTKNVDYPTNIQMLGIPPILSGKNTLLAAETGCGKTYAYLLPMLQRIRKWKPQVPDAMNSPLGLIIVPNRQLALQVGSVAGELCSLLNLTCRTLLGGHSKQLILNPQFEHVDVMVATLGVMSKLTTHKQYHTRACKHLVLDEADTLLDDSFNERLVHFVKRFPIQASGPTNEADVPTGTQLSLVSATMPTSLPRVLGDIVAIPSLEKISTKYLHRVQPHIPQHFIRVAKPQKAEELLKLVKKDVKNNVPTMIFCNKTKSCDWVSLFLNENDINCIRYNSGMSADTRLGQYEQFASGYADVICCTDIASRGLDCTRVKHIINFDFPLYMADYIHRCGRTGRIGHYKDCKITNIITSRREIDLLQEIEKAARLRDVLPNVNNNITRIVKYKTLKNEGDLQQ